MRIGELSTRSGVSMRSLRYYESKGMLTASRSANGYRDYDEEAVPRASAIHALFGMGFPRAVVESVLACAGDAPPEVHESLYDELDRVRAQLDARIAEMSRTRDAVAAFLAARPRLPDAGDRPSPVS